VAVKILVVCDAGNGATHLWQENADDEADAKTKIAKWATEGLYHHNNVGKCFHPGSAIACMTIIT
jgi:hypothetical protein